MFTHIPLQKTQSVAHPVQWLATLTAEPLGLGSNTAEDMDVCKCVMTSRHGGTLNSHPAASPLARLVEGKKWDAPDHPQGVLPQNWSDRRQLALCHDEFRGP
ncbi:cullin-4A [Trichonephila clavipes]|nr:cullin-4A [Trichonephila clavipes]